MGNNTFWQRFRFKFRVSVLNENTLNEVWHIRLSRAGVILMITGLFVVIFAIISVLIWFTPLNRYLPGYNANLRSDIVEQVARVDSLGEQVTLQKQYIDAMRSVLTGEVSTDTVLSLDSLAIVQREQLLEAKNAVTEGFLNQYEQKEREQLILFNQPQSAPVITMFRPVRGIIQQQFSEQEGRYGIQIETADKQTVASVLAGTVVAVMPSMTDKWCIIIQHENDFISIYRNLSKPRYAIGDKVDTGTIIGATAANILTFELWKKGHPINPQNTIIF